MTREQAAEDTLKTLRSVSSRAYRSGLLDGATLVITIFFLYIIWS